MLNTASEVNMLTMLAVIKINENDDKKKKNTSSKSRGISVIHCTSKLLIHFPQSVTKRAEN